jgi:hypothetical protein
LGTVFTAVCAVFEWNEFNERVLSKIWRPMKKN